MAHEKNTFLRLFTDEEMTQQVFKVNISLKNAISLEELATGWTDIPRKDKGHTVDIYFEGNKIATLDRIDATLWHIKDALFHIDEPYWLNCICVAEHELAQM